MREKFERIYEYIKTHAPHENRRHQIANALGISYQTVVLATLALEIGGRIERHPEKIGNAFAYVVKSAEHEPLVKAV